MMQQRGPGGRHVTYQIENCAHIAGIDIGDGNYSVWVAYLLGGSSHAASLWLRRRRGRADAAASPLRTGRTLAVRVRGAPVIAGALERRACTEVEK